MSSCGCPALLALGLLGALACAKELDPQPAPTGRVVALFDPALQVVPSPTDLVRDAETGLLRVPVADAATRPAQAAFDRYLNTLDGVPLATALALCLSGPPDAASVAEGLRVLALPREAGVAATLVEGLRATEPTSTLDCPVLTARSCDPRAASSGCAASQRCVATNAAAPTVGRCADAGYRVIVKASAPWQPAQSYAVLLTRAATAASDGRALLRAPIFELVAQSHRLCAWDPDARRCTYNYARLITSTAGLQAAQAMPQATLDAQRVHAAELELQLATQLESLRRGTDRLLQLGEAAGIPRAEVVLAWGFTTLGLAEARFDPAAGVLPGPGNDLIYDGARIDAEGQPAPRVAVPGPTCTSNADCALGSCQPEEVRRGAPQRQCSTRPAGGAGDWRGFLGRHVEEAAQDWALRRGLNGLDGFSTTASYFAEFSAPLAPASVAAGGELLLFDLTALANESASASFSLEAGGRALAMTPRAPLAERHRYAVVLRSRRKLAATSGGASPAALTSASGGGLADAQERRVVASPAFALARSPSPLIDAVGKATVNVVDDATAAQLEPLRVAYDQVLSALEALPALNLEREDVVLLWTFTTQSISAALTALRALPYQTLAAADGGSPRWSGTLVTSFDGWPAAAPRSAIGGWVPQGSFTSWNALDPATEALRPDPSAGATSVVPFFLSVPQGAAPATGWPFVLFQHGLNQSKTSFFTVANTLAQAGMATLAFDIGFHGARSVCTRHEACGCARDADCVAEAGDVPGRCDVTGAPQADPPRGPTFTCSTRLRETEPCTLTTALERRRCSTGQLADSDGDGTPDASGVAFLAPSNPFALRDNLRQHVIDAAALLRGLRLGAAAGLANATPVVLDPARVHYVGHSLGAILGVLVLATEPLSVGAGPQRAVLNVGGAPVVRIFEDTPDVDFRGVVDGLLQQRGITRGSVEALRLFHTLQWVVDPADPANFARYLTQASLPDLVASQQEGRSIALAPKQVLAQLATADAVIPPERQAALAGWIVGPAQQSGYPVGHGFLLLPDAAAPAATTLAQQQLAHFLLSGEVCTPELSAAPPSCN
ncbi:MAG: hypothetical protein IPL40_12360 [Proteobacteria bacterium]|nr:hypothetical protein [Pseudomonadota bacterium]